MGRRYAARGDSEKAGESRLGEQRVPSLLDLSETPAQEDGRYGHGQQETREAGRKRPSSVAWPRWESAITRTSTGI